MLHLPPRRGQNLCGRKRNRRMRQLPNPSRQRLGWNPHTRLRLQRHHTLRRPPARRFRTSRRVANPTESRMVVQNRPARGSGARRMRRNDGESCAVQAMKCLIS